MTVYRANYGDALYGQDTYGLSGSITDASATITPSCSVSVSAVKIFQGSASASLLCSVASSLQQVKDAASAVSASCSVTAAADIIINVAASTSSAASATSAAIKVRNAAAAISLQNAVVTAAVEYPETEGFRAGYGLGTYGSFVYGENYSVEEAAASITPACSVSVSGVAVRNVAASITPSASVVSNGFIDVVGQSNVGLSSSVNISYNRVRLMAASLNAASTITTVARYKWLDATDPTTVWTDATEASTTWTDADYLERAA